MLFKDHFSKSAPQYRKYRPGYPENLFGFLASLCPGRETAVDAATGSGQAAVGISPFFRRVVAIDASIEQVRNARLKGGIYYMVCLAEVAALRDSTADLVLSAQSAHWFDLHRFCSEAQRVLRPGGAAAIFCYGLFRINPDIDRIIDRLYSEIVGSFWPPERKLVDLEYRSMYFPFAELRTPEFEMEAQWDLDHLIGYLGTWSAVNGYMQANGGLDPVGIIKEEIHTVWGDPSTVRRVVWPIHMRAGKKQ